MSVVERPATARLERRVRRYAARLARATSEANAIISQAEADFRDACVRATKYPARSKQILTVAVDVRRDALGRAEDLRRAIRKTADHADPEAADEYWSRKHATASNR